MAVQQNDDTLPIAYKPITVGFPIIQTDQLNATLDAALKGGAPTTAFFEQLNKTAAFWSDIAEGTLSFVDGVDPSGTPVVMASSGDIDMRIIATWSGATDITVPFGTMVVQLANTHTFVQQAMAFQILLTQPPPQGPVGEALFDALRPTLYSSFADLIRTMAAQLAIMSATKDPSIDPQTFIVTLLSAASQKAISGLGALAAWGLSKIIIDFNELAFSLGAVAPLMAVPLVFEYLAHAMYLSVLVINNSTLDFKLSLADQPHGQASVTWASAALPGLRRTDFPIGPDGPAVLLQNALSQYINTNTWSSIGIVLATDAEGGDQTAEVVSVPWAGDNTIWAGAPSSSPGQTWDDHNSPNGQLAYATTRGNYTVRMATNKLEGETDGQYWYAALIEIS
jgi:hypothetical protein